MQIQKNLEELFQKCWLYVSYGLIFWLRRFKGTIHGRHQENQVYIRVESDFTPTSLIGILIHLRTLEKHILNFSSCVLFLWLVLCTFKFWFLFQSLWESWSCWKDFVLSDLMFCLALFYFYFPGLVPQIKDFLFQPIFCICPAAVTKKIQFPQNDDFHWVSPWPGSAELCRDTAAASDPQRSSSLSLQPLHPDRLRRKHQVSISLVYIRANRKHLHVAFWRKTP